MGIKLCRYPSVCINGAHAGFARQYVKGVNSRRAGGLRPSAIALPIDFGQHFLVVHMINQRASCVNGPFGYLFVQITARGANIEVLPAKKTLVRTRCVHTSGNPQQVYLPSEDSPSIFFMAHIRCSFIHNNRETRIG